MAESRTILANRIWTKGRRAGVPIRNIWLEERLVDRGSTMSTSITPNQRICDDFIECLSQFVGAGSTWEVEKNKQKPGSDVVVTVRPRAQEAAPIDARLELDFGVYLLFGVAAQFEI